MLSIFILLCYGKLSECQVKKPLQIWLDEDLIREIKISALQQNTNVTKLIEKLLKKHLKKK